MKKIYSKPVMNVVTINAEQQFLTLSGLGQEYTSTDVSYVKGNSTPSNYSVWDDDWSN